MKILIVRKDEDNIWLLGARRLGQWSRNRFLAITSSFQVGPRYGADNGKHSGKVRDVHCDLRAKVKESKFHGNNFI